MQLRLARLCLDCEEVHDQPQCPLCASETFAYLTRWVPAREGRPTTRPVQHVPVTAAAGKRRIRGRAVGLGIAGLGILGLARWITKGRDFIEDTATRNIGELK